MPPAAGPPCPVHVGIDVGSKTLQLALRTNGEFFEEAYANDVAGRKAIAKKLASYKASVRIVIEATGNYSRDACELLAKGKYNQVMLINPRAAKHAAKAMMTRAKTDRVDARLLSTLAAADHFVPWHAPAKVVSDVRAAIRRVNSLVESGAAEKNHLAAANATGTTPAIVIADIESEIAALDIRIVKMRNVARALVKGDPTLSKNYTSLMSIPGIGDITALNMLAELSALPTDMVAKQVVAYAGLDPRPAESGTKVGKRSISRMGNARLRTMLFLPALTASRMDGPFKVIYDQLVARGKAPKVAIVAVMRRLLTTAWTLLSKGEMFDEKKVGKTITPP